MIFSVNTLRKASQIVSQILAPQDSLPTPSLNIILLSCLSGMELAEPFAKLQAVHYIDDEEKILLAIACLCELDNQTSSKVFIPLDIIDIMGHIFANSSIMPICCHSYASLPLALWYAHLGFPIYYTGDEKHIPYIKALSKNENIFSGEPETQSLHIIFHNVAEKYKSEALIRKILKTNFAALAFFTNWSFLSSTAASCYLLKNKVITSNTLETVIQFPAGVKPKILPALLVLNRTKKNDKIQLINAKKWTYSQAQQFYSVSYPRPILNTLAGESSNKEMPAPPKEEVDVSQLLERQCDLRMKDKSYIVFDDNKSENLGSCASLIRGQMIPQNFDLVDGDEYNEVVLSDINEFGFITSASRLLTHVPQLPRSRDMSKLKVHDILIVTKGSLQSLGKIGLILDAQSNWFPNQSFHLVRTDALDPIWLYYFLRTQRVQHFFQTHSSGTSIPQIKIADLISINIPMPNSEELKKIHNYHSSLLKKMKKVMSYKEDIYSTIDEATKTIRNFEKL